MASFSLLPPYFDLRSTFVSTFFFPTLVLTISILLPLFPLSLPPLSYFQFSYFFFFVYIPISLFSLDIFMFSVLDVLFSLSLILCGQIIALAPYFFINFPSLSSDHRDCRIKQFILLSIFDLNTRELFR